jgi:hypothetical protein
MYFINAVPKTLSVIAVADAHVFHSDHHHATTYEIGRGWMANCPTISLEAFVCIFLYFLWLFHDIVGNQFYIISWFYT